MLTSRLSPSYWADMAKASVKRVNSIKKTSTMTVSSSGYETCKKQADVTNTFQIEIFACGC